MFCTVCSEVIVVIVRYIKIMESVFSEKRC